MIGEIISKLNNTVISTTNPVPSYLDYSVTYSDGTTIAPNHLLAANTSETYKVRVEFKRDIEESDLPTTDQTNTFSFGVSYVQSDSTAIAVPHSTTSTVYTVNVYDEEHEEDTVQRRAAQGCARAWAALLKALWKAAGPFIAGALGGFAAAARSRA